MLGRDAGYGHHRDGRAFLLLRLWAVCVSVVHCLTVTRREALTDKIDDNSRHVSRNLSIKVLEHPGGVRGLHVFKEALLRDLPAAYEEQLKNCDVYIYSNPKYVIEVPEATRNRRVWMVLNGEGPSGEDTSVGMLDQIGPQDRLMILGNWWNRTTENYTDSRVSSLWVPYASLSFAERVNANPLDLLRNAATKMPIVDEGEKIHQNERRLVAYQQRNCVQNREVFWDILNEKLRAEVNTTGECLGKCNGRKMLGARSTSSPPLRRHQAKRKYSSGFDESVDRFRDFKFVVAMEHNTNAIGYVTEKIINAFLAGAIPIYSGASQDNMIFNPRSFIQVHPGQDDAIVAEHVIKLSKDPKGLAEMAREEVLSDDVLRRFFSWHPAVWPRTGDVLRRNVMDELVRQCRTSA